MAGKWYTIEEKLNILSECDQGNASLKEIADKYGVHVLQPRSSTSKTKRPQPGGIQG